MKKNRWSKNNQRKNEATRRWLYKLKLTWKQCFVLLILKCPYTHSVISRSCHWVDIKSEWTCTIPLL